MILQAAAGARHIALPATHRHAYRHTVVRIVNYILHGHGTDHHITVKSDTSATYPTVSLLGLCQFYCFVIDGIV